MIGDTPAILPTSRRDNAPTLVAKLVWPAPLPLHDPWWCVGPSHAPSQTGDHVAPARDVPHAPPHHITLRSAGSCARLGHGIVGLVGPRTTLGCPGACDVGRDATENATENALPRDES